MTRLHVRAQYTVPEGQDTQATLEWLASEHYADLREQMTLYRFDVSSRDHQVEVLLIVDKTAWQAYIASEARGTISDAAVEHGFTSAKVFTEYASFSDDDSSPSGSHGHGPESRDGGNFESAVHHFG